MHELSGTSAAFIIPVYNRMSSLVNTLDSIEEFCLQPSIEIVVVNDNSSDSLCYEYLLEKCSPIITNRINYIANPVNMGVTYSKNIGAFHTLCNWLIFLDSDDLMLPNSCDLIMNTLSKADDQDNFVHAYFFRCISASNGKIIGEHANSHALSLAEYLKYGTHGECLPVIRRESFLDSPYDPYLRGCEGWSYINMLLSGKRLVIISQPARLYDDQSYDRLSSSHNVKRRSMLIASYYLKCCILVYKKSGLLYLRGLLKFFYHAFQHIIYLAVR